MKKEENKLFHVTIRHANAKVVFLFNGAGQMVQKNKQNIDSTERGFAIF